MNIETEMKYLHNYQLSGMIDNPKIIKFPGDGINIIMRSEKTNLIAFSDPIINTDHCYLRMLFIQEHYRGRGIGKELIHNLIRMCISKNIRAIEVESEDNSIKFFKKLGFYFIMSEDKNRMRYEF